MNYSFSTETVSIIIIECVSRPNSAQLTQGFLAQNGINVLVWPAVSPDLNLIEQMCDKLGRRVHARKNPPQNVEELGLALREEWHDIPRWNIRRLTDSSSCY